MPLFVLDSGLNSVQFFVNIPIALAGAVTAFTPAGFQPASTANLTVAFGNTLAINGVDLPKAGTQCVFRPVNMPNTLLDTQTAPTIGTAERLTGTYVIMMVDPDIPSNTAGGPTTELLHWMQGGLVSANSSSKVAGVTVFELVNPSNTTAFASYIGPSPPNKSPTSHRYTQLLMRTDGNNSVLTTLAKFGMTRSNFSAVNVVKSSGLTVLSGNSFNVTANSGTTGIGNGNSTIPGVTTSTSTIFESSPTGTNTGNGNSPTSNVPVKGGVGKTGNDAFIVGLGAFIAAAVIL